MTRSKNALKAAGAGVLMTTMLLWGSSVNTAPPSRKTISTEEEFHQAMKDLSNWNRWGPDDVLGAANLITPAKRKQAAALVKEGISVSMEHPIFQEDVVDGNGHLERTVVSARPGGAADKYSFTATYHGSHYSHLDAINCHMMMD